MRALLLSVALAGLLPAVQPRTPVLLRVGDARVNARALQPYKARWKETMVGVGHDVTERAVWNDELRRETMNGRDVLIRTMVAIQPDGTTRESRRTVVDGVTFAPLRSEWKSLGISYDYDFDGLAIHGARVNEPFASPSRIEAKLWQPAFDYYGGMMELFLATLPRTAGVFSFPTAMATTGAGAVQDSIHWPLVEVIGEDVTRGVGGKTVKAWRVEANTPYGFYKVWVTDTPPHVVRTVLLLGPGGRITFELL